MKCKNFKKVEESRKDFLISMLSVISDEVTGEEFAVIFYEVDNYVNSSSNCLQCEEICLFNKENIAMEALEAIAQ